MPLLGRAIAEVHFAPSMNLSSCRTKKHVPAICFALVYIGLGDRDEAVTRLEEAYKERSDFLLVLSVDPLFDGLRSDPRFRDLLRRMKLPDVPYFAGATSILKGGTPGAGSH